MLNLTETWIKFGKKFGEFWQNNKVLLRVLTNWIDSGNVTAINNVCGSDKRQDKKTKKTSKTASNIFYLILLTDSQTWLVFFFTFCDNGLFKLTGAISWPFLHVWKGTFQRPHLARIRMRQVEGGRRSSDSKAGLASPGKRWAPPPNQRERSGDKQIHKLERGENIDFVGRIEAIIMRTS